jgi:hypothetical protein
MPERPLLIFPEPEHASRSGLGPLVGGPHRPDHGRQSQRLHPKLEQLQRTFEARLVEVRQNLGWADPEQVLVMETVGNIDNFANAVRRIQGLEWMGELELDEILPDEDFYDEDHPERELRGRLFLVMANQHALNQLLSLWRRYKDNPEMEFEYGLKKFAYVFDALKDLRRWGLQDRLLETGILDIWREELAHDGDALIPFEAELWFRSDMGRRVASEQALNQLINDLDGQTVTQCIIPEIAYHAILGNLPRNAVQDIVNEPSTNLVKCDYVMFFRPVGQMAAGYRRSDGEPQTFLAVTRPSPKGPPAVAVLDGLPLANHQLLAGRLIIDDPDDWANDYTAAERRHGTAMASLIVLGDLNTDSNVLTSPVYVRPIMKPLVGVDHPLIECIPGDVLPVDLIHRAVRRLFEQDGDHEAVADTVKIINLSIGDPCRQFDRAMSPLARLLDWLSLKYRVLFIVSAGNCPRDIDIPISEAEYDALTPEEREEAVVRAILHEGRLRRMLSPAEAINVLTIGAWHKDGVQNGHRDTRIDPYVNPLPSPVSPLGGGYRRSIKPDMLFVGGRQLYRKRFAGNDPGNIRLELADFLSPPGCNVAYPGTPGILNSTAHCVGTSNAAALVTRFGVICYDELARVLADQAPEVQADSCIAPLLKALLVHGASWGELDVRLREIIGDNYDARSARNLLTRWIGYGVPDFTRAVECSGQRATVLGFGELDDGNAHVFRLPLPPSLAAKREWRRLTVTLAWFSPTMSSSQKYRVASLWYEADADDLSASRQAVDWQAARRGTVQHEIFEGDRAVPFADGDALVIKVNCRQEAGKITSPVPYGLVVSLEVAEGIDIAIYEEIRSRIAVPIAIPQQATGH